MESTDSSAESQNPHLPPGFRFHPTDEELVVHYLKKKAAADPLPVSIIAEVDLYKFDPWELPAKAIFGEQEWYFFTPRDRKYPNGARPNRAATSGYWKATGTDKPVLTAGGAQKVGVKKALVFYAGKPPKGIKTSWIMHEYRLADGKAQPNKPPGYENAKKASLRLDDWVLCRIYKKNNTTQRPVGHEGDPTNEMGLDSIHGIKPPSTYCSFLETEHDFYEQQGMASNDINDNLCSSRSKPPSSLQFPFMDTNRNTLGKKMLQNFYWVDGDENGNSTSPRDKSFIVDTCGASNSMINIMGQLSRAEDMETQVVIDNNVGDDVLRQSYQISSMNWYD